MTKYVYDGDQCIAEYDGDDTLLRKFIYGPGIDQPICMIEVQDANAAYFYHYDALGSVVALSDAGGDTVQVYEYDVYGQVAASDPNHTNRFMFTGREFDKDTGLYYYRARYYNPSIGRFLQTDPIGYEGGMNLYAYCGNNPWNSVDPYGRESSTHVDDPRNSPWREGADECNRVKTLEWTLMMERYSKPASRRAIYDVAGFLLCAIGCAMITRGAALGWCAGACFAAVGAIEFFLWSSGPYKRFWDQVNYINAKYDYCFCRAEDGLNCSHEECLLKGIAPPAPPA